MARIMIVDDSAIMRSNLKLMLERAGHEVIAEAIDGIDAIRTIDREKVQPELITMDISMPGMDGLEAMLQIRSQYPWIKFIVISANDQKPMLFKAVKNGASHYIIKPLSEDKVVSVVKKVLESDRKHG